MKKGELPVGLLYLSLHNQLKRKVGLNGFISRKEFYTIIGKHYLIPRKLRDCQINEMENLKLISIVDKSTIKILKCNLDLEKDEDKIYKLAGLF